MYMYIEIGCKNRLLALNSSSWEWNLRIEWYRSGMKHCEWSGLFHNQKECQKLLGNKQNLLKVNLPQLASQIIWKFFPLCHACVISIVCYQWGAETFQFVMVEKNPRKYTRKSLVLECKMVWICCVSYVLHSKMFIYKLSFVFGV